MSILLQSIIKTIIPLNLINKISIVIFPTWILYNFFPNDYVSIKNTLLVKPVNLANIILIIRFVLNVLIYINYTIVFLLSVLSIAFIIQSIISFISFKYISSDNDLRDDLFHFILKLCIFISIYIVSISMYSDLFINYSIPLKIIYTTKAYWISIFPFIIIITVFIIRIIFPRRTY